MLSRLDSLWEMYDQNPQDPFFMYAIGLELQTTNPQKTQEIWENLIVNFAEYLPTYYALAKLYEDLEQITLAKNMYEKGIEVAKSQKNVKIQKELQNALQNVELA